MPAPKTDAAKIPGRTLRKDRSGADPFRVGAVVLLIVGICTFLGFSKHIPFTHGFQVKAVFTQANSIRKNSPVRIAGVNVGKVKKIERQPGTTAAIVTLEFQKKGLPLHTDTTMKIRPRIFLEGNFFVDVKPGTPSAPDLKADATIPVTQTATPVQLDQVLTSLQESSRDDLKAALKGFGDSLTLKPTAAEDADQDPSVRGLTGAQALNKSFDKGPDALKYVSIVNNGLLGNEPDDLAKLISSFGTAAGALDKNESSLTGFLVNFNTTMASFASQSTNLKTSIHLLGPTLNSANRALASLDAAFPNTRAFAKEVLPGVRETAGTISAALPWIAQTNGLLGKKELRGVAENLSPSVAHLSKVVSATKALLPQADLLAQCATKVILPTGDIKIDDGPLTTGAENYKEFWYTMVGLAGEGQNFDGNGSYVRFAVGGGDQTISTGKVGGSLGDTMFGKSNTKPIGTRPAFPGHHPPYVSSERCKDQKIPDLNDAKVGPADGGASGSAAQAAISRQAAAESATKGTLSSDPQSLTAALVSRLNPFRKGDR
jgi:ABC-type transporter Mla subunit MlaD